MRQNKSRWAGMWCSKSCLSNCDRTLLRDSGSKGGAVGGGLHHTNIVPVFGVGEEGGHHYYVMQYIEGLGLDGVLDELRRLRHQKETVGFDAGCPTDDVVAPGRVGRDGGGVALDGGVSTNDQGWGPGAGTVGGWGSDPR